jgi:hypothetical protein
MTTKTTRSSITILTLGLLLALAGPGLAGAGDGGGDGGGDRDRPPHPPRRRPPPAAFEACQQKQAGEACQVELPDHTIDGRCIASEEGPLFCRPARPPGPPPELFQVCEGKAEGDTCSVRFHDDDTREGKCRQGRSGRLLCMPH